MGSEGSPEGRTPLLPTALYRGCWALVTRRRCPDPSVRVTFVPGVCLRVCPCAGTWPTHMCAHSFVRLLSTCLYEAAVIQPKLALGTYRRTRQKQVLQTVRRGDTGQRLGPGMTGTGFQSGHARGQLWGLPVLTDFSSVEKLLGVFTPCRGLVLFRLPACGC